MSYRCICGHSFFKETHRTAHFKRYNCQRFIQSGLLAFQCECGEYFKKEKYYQEHLITCNYYNDNTDNDILEEIKIIKKELKEINKDIAEIETNCFNDFYVINLEHRTDRWEHIEKTFGANFNLKRVDAVKHENGAVGCFMSHQKCIQLAKDKNMDYIAVLEDDCTISPNYQNNFIETYENIKKFLTSFHNWNIFLGGTGDVGRNIIKINNNKINNIYQIQQGCCTHFILYNKSCYDFFLNLNPYEKSLDLIWWHKLKAFTIVPFIAYQLEGKGDIQSSANSTYDYIKVNEKYILKNIKRKHFKTVNYKF